MKKLKKIEETIDALNNDMNAKRDALNEQALTIMTKALNKNKALKTAISSLYQSKALTEMQFDEYLYRYIHTDISKFIDTNSSFQRELFERYMQNTHFISVDFKNDTLSQCEGPCIIVNHEGDVLDQDSQKWIINKRDYETDEERNALIEAWMEKSGYFPSVIQCGRNGVEGYINTKS